MSDLHHDRHFLLDEAQKALVEVGPMVEAMSALKKTLDQLGFNRPAAPVVTVAGRSTNGHHPPPKEFIQLMDVLRRITNMGIQVKDVGRGLIDFPHIRANGEEVYLCWILREESIAFWHRIEDGFAGRQPVETL